MEVLFSAPRLPVFGVLDQFLAALGGGSHSLSISADPSYSSTWFIGHAGKRGRF